MTITTLAILGGEPEFKIPVPVGQLYFPSRDLYAQKMKELFERQCYTNHGPQLIEFENKLASYLNVSDVICVTNNTMGLIIVAEALGLKGSVIMPSFTFIATALSLKRCGLTPVFCDIKPNSIFPSAKELEECYTHDVSGIIGVHLWGSCAPVSEIETWAEQKQLKIFWDSAQAFGCEVNNQRVGGNGSAEVFSFHATKILSTAEGGCIATNNRGLAEKMRNIRSSYGINKKVKVNRTTNARMSEMQAALGLLALEKVDEYTNYNTDMRGKYAETISSISGISLMPNIGVSKSNNQNIVLIVDAEEFGLSRDLIVKSLNEDGIMARRYFLPSLHNQSQFADGRSINLPNTDSFQRKNIAMPIGARVNDEIIERIIGILKSIQINAPSIKRL